jgi:hypothetical protein
LTQPSPFGVAFFFEQRFSAAKIVVGQDANPADLVA